MSSMVWSVQNAYRDVCLSRGLWDVEMLRFRPISHVGWDGLSSGWCQDKRRKVDNSTIESQS